MRFRRKRRFGARRPTRRRFNSRRRRSSSPMRIGFRM